MLSRDILSFDVCLDEMLTGGLAFTGHNAIGVIGAILHKETPPIDEVQLSLDIRRVVENACGSIAKSVTSNGTG